MRGGCGYTDRYVALCDCDSTRFIHLTISFFSPRLLQGCLDTIIDIGKKHANNQRFPRCEILIYCFVAKPLSSQIFYPRKTFTRKTSIPAKPLSSQIFYPRKTFTRKTSIPAKLLSPQNFYLQILFLQNMLTIKGFQDVRF